MKIRLYISVVFLLSIFIKAQSINYEKEEAIVVYKKQNMANSVLLNSAMSNSFPNSFEVKTYKKAINASVVKVKDKNFTEIKKILMNDKSLKDSIEYIEPNYVYTMQSNDKHYSKLWAFDNRGGTTTSKEDADIDAPFAWKIEEGSSDVVVAVLDSGIDYTHEDLLDNIWSGSYGGGYDFAGNANGDNDSDPMPETPYNENYHYHGTHIAGIIAAVGNNKKGVIGVAPNVKLMNLKVFRPDGLARTSDILEALDYIALKIDNGVNVVAINASYGGASYSKAMYDALSLLKSKNVLFCAAAGNKHHNNDALLYYPASYDLPNIISVAASDQKDNLTAFTNYGKKSVDLAAPGSLIYSTYPSNGYSYLNGTSMAAPMVAGTVALLASVEPDSDFKQRKDAILNSVDKKNIYKDYVLSGGRLNTYKAIELIQNKPLPQLVAKSDSANVVIGKSVIIDVLKNDIYNKPPIKLTILYKPSKGSVTIRNNKIEYTPNVSYTTKDTFVYKIDNGIDISEASVNINIEKSKDTNRAPVAQNDTVTVYKNTTTTINVLANDSDPDKDKISIYKVEQAKHGKVVVKNDKLEYTPNYNYIGNDSFKYTIKDSHGKTSSAIVFIEIKNKKIRIFANIDNAKTKMNRAIEINVLANDRYENKNIVKVKISRYPHRGSVKVLANKNILYTPDKNYVGKDSFMYTISDSGDSDASAEVYILVERDNNRAPIAKDDYITILEDQQNVNINELANDYDPDGDAVYIAFMGQAKHGKVTMVNNSFKYTPNKNFNGSDSFSYKIADNTGTVSNLATVHITVKAVNDAPVAKDDIVNMYSNSSTLIDVLSNDYDVDGDKLKVIIDNNTPPPPPPPPSSQRIILEDAEHGVQNWKSLTERREDKVSIVYDNTLKSKVLKIEGTNSSKFIYGIGANEWHIKNKSVISWKMKYNKDYAFYIRVQTTNGFRFLKYIPSNSGLGKHEVYIVNSLGEESKDGNWHTITRDLQADLNRYEANNKILEVNGIIVMPGLIDDLYLK